MIRKVILLLFVIELLSGCAAMFDNTRLYDGSIPEPPHRWPDRVETCGYDRFVLLPLNLVLKATSFTGMPGYRGGCGGFAAGMSPIEIRHVDSMWSGLIGVDSTGRGRSFHVYYAWKIAKDSSFEPNVGYTPDWAYHFPDSKTVPGRWQYNVPIPTKHKTFESNGLTWHHDLFVGFYSFNDDPTQPGIPAAVGDASFVELPYPVIKTPQQRALQWLGEVYTLKVDDSHSMKIWASYSRPVTQDAHWLKVRRAMLIQLLEAVIIKPLTPELLRKLQVEKQAQDRCLDNGGGGDCARIGRWSDQISSN